MAEVVRVIEAEGGTGPPAQGGEAALALHREHGLRACDVRHLTIPDLEAAGVADGAAVLAALTAPPPEPA